MARSLLVILVLLALSAGAASVDAGSDYTCWQAEPSVGGDWFDAAHWTGGVPTTGNVAAIENGGTAVIESGTAVAQRAKIGSEALPDLAVGGAVIQTGGRAELGYSMTLGYERSSKGTYTLIGGTLTGGSVTVGYYYGSGEFHQIGGISSFSGAVVVGARPYNANQPLNASLGLYELSGGQLSSRATDVGCAGRGRFVQSGGSHEVTQTLTVGGPGPLRPISLPPSSRFITFDPNLPGSGEGAACAVTEPAGAVVTNVYIAPPGPSEGFYELSGGRLAAGDLLIQRTGRFTQTGGAAAVGLLAIGVGARYEYLGGTLDLSAGLALQGWPDPVDPNGEPHVGVLDFGDTSVTLTGGGILDFSHGRVLGAGQATLSAGPNSLVLVPAGFDPAAEFGQFVCQGLVHEAGSDLVLGEGQGFTGWGTIADHVEASGWIAAAAGGRIDLAGGAMVAGGQVDLGPGCLTVQDDRSGISAGRLDADTLDVGTFVLGIYGEPPPPAGPPIFRQTGGDVGIADTATIYRGAYELFGGTLTCRQLEVGGPWSNRGTAEFLQAGGTANVQTLWVGRYVPIVFHTNSAALDLQTEILPSEPASGLPAVVALPLGDKADAQEPTGTTYRMQGGRLSVQRLVIDGDWQSAWFVQTGGEVVAGNVNISPSDASYVISAGRLTAGQLDVGYHHSYVSGGTLAVLSPAAEIRVSERLSFGDGSIFLAAPGATIHVTGPSSDPAKLWRAGATFANWSTDPAALSGLGNLKLIFEGGLDWAATLEVAGEDRGPGYAGFFENFALDTLQIGGEAPAAVQLVDLFDNHPDLPGGEALYVEALIIGPGSSLDLNGLTLYCLASDIAPGAQLTNGAVLPIPEPATLALLAAAAACALLRRAPRHAR